MKPRLRVLEFGIVALIPLLIFGTFFFAHFNRDWSVAADLEFLLAYNATLINAGTNQEYYDHPGFFTIYFLAFLIKLSRALGFTSISVIEDLNNFSPLFNGFTQVTVVARFLAVSTVGILIFWWFWIARRFLNHQWLALWIVLCIFFSGSMTLHYSQLRTEPIAFLFLIAAVLCLAKILVTAGNGKIILLFFAVLFAFLAALNKTQVIFYLPIYFFWAICFFPHQATKKKLPYRHRTQALFTLLGSVVCIYIACKYAIYPSQYFNGAFLLSLYFVIWFYWRNVGGNLSIQINLFNLFFIFIFLLIQFSLKIYGLNALELLKQIQSPLGMLVFSSRNIQGIFATPLSSNTFDFYMTIKYIFNPIKNVLGTLSSQSIFFYSNILLWALLRKNLNCKDNLGLVVSLVSFFMVTDITSTRYAAAQYIIFSEFFLIAAFIFLISKLENRRLQWLLVIGIGALIIYCGFPKLWRDLNSTSNGYASLCNPTNDYMRFWHPKLNYQNFLDACKAKGF